MWSAWFLNFVFIILNVNIDYRVNYLFLLPKIALITNLPTFLSSPCLVVGTPVLRVIFCLAAVIPIALFQEKLNPFILTIVVSCNK